jgi:D-aminopeptidase
VSDQGAAVTFDERKIDAIFAELDQGSLPGAAVGIALEGKPVYRKAFGRASLELPTILSPSSRLRIGSTTKHFAALSYLLLCEDGKARLEDPIRAYLPEMHSVADQITTRQLMAHTSGLRDSHDIAWQFSGTGHPVSPAELLTFYRDIDDVNAMPGTTWSYSNGGYLLLTLAVERISGRSFEEVLRERIFEPCGMYDTLLRRWDTDFVPNSATLHMTTSEGGYIRSYLGSALTGEGGIVSTVDDMLRWLAHMAHPVVGCAETWRTLKMPQTLANGVSTGYGCGLITSRYRGIEVLSHPGGVMGGNAQMLKVPAAGLDVVVLVNRHDVLGMTLANQVLDACLPGLDLVPERAPEEVYASGTFYSPRSSRVIQLSSKDQQQIVSIDGDDMPFVRGEDGALRHAALWGFVRQRVVLAGDAACPSGLTFEDFGNVDRLRPVNAHEDCDVAAIAGIYCSHSTGTRAQIVASDEGPRMNTFGRFGSAVYRLESLSRSIWRARALGVMPWGGMLVFDQAGIGFRWSTSRTRALPFRRES